MKSLLDVVRMAALREDEELASLRLDATASLSDGTRTQIADAILRAQKPGPGVRPASLPVRGSVANGPFASGRFSRRTWGVAAGGLVAVVAAAAAFMMWIRPAPGPAEALPAYFVSASGGVAELRGGTIDPADMSDKADAAGSRVASLQRLRADSELRVICRPDNSITGLIAVRAFFVRGEEAEEVSPLVRLAPTGAVDLRLSGSALLPRHKGPGALLIALGRSSDVAALVPRQVGASGAAASGAATPDRLRWLTVPLDLIDGP